MKSFKEQKQKNKWPCAFRKEREITGRAKLKEKFAARNDVMGKQAFKRLFPALPGGSLGHLVHQKVAVQF